MGDTIKTKKRSIPIQAQRLEQGMNEPTKANVCLSPDISILFYHTLFLTTLFYSFPLGKTSMKKDAFFRALPESPNPPHPLSNSGNFVLFFGRQNSKF